MSKKNRKLAAILFADIVGYTSLMQKDEQQASSIIRHFQQQLEEKVIAHNGQIVNFYGDGALCTFQIPIEAVRCAMALQTDFQKEPNVPVRIGIHSGTVTYEGDKIFGDSVNITSRIESMGIAGGVLLSKKVRDEVKNNPDLKLQSLGQIEFKNVEESMEIFALANEGLVIPQKEQIGGKLKKIAAEKTNWLIPLITAALLILVFSFWKRTTSTEMQVLENSLEPSETPLSKEIGEKRIAILFFENKTGSTELESLGEMISDWVTQRLMETGKAKMVNSGFVRKHVALANTGLTTSQSFSKQTGADVVIQGKYYLQENQLIIHAQFVDAKNGEILFALPTIRGKKEQAMELLHELTERLTSYWLLKEEDLIHKKPPKYEAFEEFLKADDYYGLDDEKALAIYAKAYQLDTTFYLPLMLSTVIHTNRGRYTAADSIYQWIKNKNPELNPLIQLHLDNMGANIRGERALFADTHLKIWEMDAGNTYIVGWTQLYYLNKPQKALDYLLTKFKSGYEYGNCPSCQWPLARMSDAYLRLGKYESVLSLVDSLKEPLIDAQTAYMHLRALIRLGMEEELAKKLAFYKNQDLKWHNTHQPADLYKIVCREYYMLNQPQKVDKYAQEFFQLTPPNATYPTLNYDVGQVYFLQGNYQKALASFKKMDIENKARLSWMGVCYALVNNKIEALKCIEDIPLYGDKNDKGYNAYYQARVYLALGNQEKAVELLQKSIDDGRLYTWSLYKYDPFLRQLFGYPPFEELVKPKG